jgi:F-box/WD-40 domain protein 7
MGNRLVSGSTDQTLKVWDLSVQDEWSSIACKVTMVGHTDTVRCVQVIKSNIHSSNSIELNITQLKL